MLVHLELHIVEYLIALLKCFLTSSQLTTCSMLRFLNNYLEWELKGLNLLQQVEVELPCHSRLSNELQVSTSEDFHFICSLSDPQLSICLFT